MTPLLEVRNLSISFFTPRSEVQAVRDVSFSLYPGEVLALVGESGCGKSVLCKSILKLLPRTARIKSGAIRLKGQDITHLRECEMRKLRGSLLSMMFQDTGTALNPTLPVGAQIAEAVRVHDPKIRKSDLSERVTGLLELVGIERPEVRQNLRPGQLSGGMRQRAVMAAALAGNPRILFADEPTTALDVTIQAQILGLLREIRQKLGTATVLVTHDLSAAARAADRAAVMYAGKIVEIGTTEEIFYDPRHPYTRALLKALLDLSKKQSILYTVPGMPPSLSPPPKGDAFASRNPFALAIDYEEEPPMFRITDTHSAATWLEDPRAPEIPAFSGGSPHV